MTLVITDSVLDHIEKSLAAVPPERGGALLSAGNIIHYLVEDTEASYTSVSWDISPALTNSVQAAEIDRRGRLRATVHTHPAGVPDPSDQDMRATARALDENPHLDEIAICIVTKGKPRPSDISVGGCHRMSIHNVRRAPGGGCRVVRVAARVLPIGRDLALDALDGRALEWNGITYLALAPERTAGKVLLVPESYPLAGPLVVDVAADGELHLPAQISWNSNGESARQLAEALDRGSRRPEGFHDRIEPLVGRLAERRVLVVGLGSVGSTVLNQLVRAGVENFVVVDPERVESANLSRTTYEAHQIGVPKCVAIAELAKRINPEAKVESIHASIADLDDTLLGYCIDADLVVAATDDPAAQAILSHHAYWTNRPLISCALYRKAAAGEVTISVPEIDTPCWSCTIGGSGGVGARPDRDYGTGRLVGEIALGPPIHIVSLVAATVAIALLSGPCTPAGVPLAELLASGRTLGIISTTPRWTFFDQVFTGVTGHQWAPQSIWAKPQRDPLCPVCGDERVAPPANFGGAVTSVLKRLRRGLSPEGDGCVPAQRPITKAHEEGGDMAIKHVNAIKLNSQRAVQAAARKAAQKARGSKNFKTGSNTHNGGSRGQSGQPKR
jgi:molybdopterin/thiamine biosynthesis adenylyltransferase